MRALTFRTSTSSFTATTLATNAIIERRGAKTALIATQGFRDVLDIGTESRYDQYDLSIDKPKPLAPRSLRFTVPERIDAHGAIRLALDEAAVRALAPALRALNVESVAFAFGQRRDCVVPTRCG